MKILNDPASLPDHLQDISVAHYRVAEAVSRQATCRFATIDGLILSCRTLAGRGSIPAIRIGTAPCEIGDFSEIGEEPVLIDSSSQSVGI